MSAMKKIATAATAIAVAAAAVTTVAPAHAEPAVTQLSTTSSGGSSKPNYRPDYDKDLDVPEKRALEGSYTGSAPISLTIALVTTLVAIQAIVDFVPPVRQAVDDVAKQFNLTHVVGSSESNRIFPAQFITSQVTQAIDQFQKNPPSFK